MTKLLIAVSALLAVANGQVFTNVQDETTLLRKNDFRRLGGIFDIFSTKKSEVEIYDPVTLQGSSKVPQEAKEAVTSTKATRDSETVKEGLSRSKAKGGESKPAFVELTPAKEGGADKKNSKDIGEVKPSLRSNVASVKSKVPQEAGETK
eukprot:CAMPEP_0119035018 /NCGR_PEP_ID=MMETSP1177-20130426/2005_1 /TAXON_ID=2985 /ORGANISM="Ochromonas sp, Strain CCMP1899" /LENGTH=149 /DNA_ID=CAMNT_0006992883 /DNA_START=78 /DNA_END=524 /DNA_ORIENTATION=+